jgi:hypothetical protein
MLVSAWQAFSEKTPVVDRLLVLTERLRLEEASARRGAAMMDELEVSSIDSITFRHFARDQAAHPGRYLVLAVLQNGQ